MLFDGFSEIETVADLGRTLRELRRREARRQGRSTMTYRQLAAATGWSRASIGEYFAGQTLPPTDRFDVLLRLLGVTGAEQGALATARDRVEEVRRARPPDSAPLLAAPIVGRDRELSVLARAVTAAGRQGGVVFVLGEAGLGKTRLTKEIEGLGAAEGVRVLRGRAGTPPVQFRPLAEALFSASRHHQLPDEESLIPFRPALSRLLPESQVPRLPGADDSLVVLAEAVLRLLASIGRDGGCAMVLDDLHDADEDTLAVLDYLTDNVAGEHVLLVGLLRPEPGRAAELVAACGQRGVATTLELSPLDDGSVARLAAGCLGVPPESVPAGVLTHLTTRAGGNPFYAEELLAAMVSDGHLVRAGGGWRCGALPGGGAPPAVRASVTTRVARLGPLGPPVLRAAALLGQRFPAGLVGAMAEVDGARLLAVLRAAVAAHLVVVDDGCYAFRHALVTEALRASILPEERAGLSRRAALAIETEYPRLPDQWCVLAAELWQYAGDVRRAAELLCEAGHRAAATGAVATAVTLFERGVDLLRDNGFPIPEALLYALLDVLVAAGQLPRALELGTQLAASTEHRANAHLRLARAAAAAADWRAGQRELDTVRALLGPSPAPEVAVRVDAVAAQLAFADPGAERLARAEALARRALRAAMRLSLPEIACESLEVLGICARTRDFDESDALFTRALNLAAGNDLALWRLRLLFHLGAQDGIRAADPARLTETHHAALRAGAIVTALDVATELAMVHLARAEYVEADRYARTCAETATRMRSAELTVVATGLRVCVAAQQGRRADVTGLLDDYDRLGGRDSEFASVVWGFGLAFCSLLEEDRDRALAELEHAVAAEADRPPQYLSFTPGPHLFLAVLARRAGRAEHDVLASSAQGIARWNRQFLALAEAVLAGRSGDHRGAAGAVARFRQAARPYPLALHIGLRLAAESAASDGWGIPGPWAKAAEEYFRGRAPRVAAACRTLLGHK